MATNKSTGIVRNKEDENAYDGIYKSRGSYNNIGRTFVNSDTNISVRSEYTRQDYNYYRGYESTLRTDYENIQLSMRAYDKVGIVRNVIELMSDFVCKGIKLIHPVASQERFYQEWFKYVNGTGVSERFANYLYRVANVPVNITYGKVPVKIEKKWSAARGEEQEIVDVKVEKRRIPLRYSFINPMNIEVIAPELAIFNGKPMYAVRVSTSLLGSYQKFQQMNIGYSDDEYANYIPTFITDALKKGQTLIPVNNDNVKIFFYKKDDWKVWADSMIVPIMDDLIMLDKMKLGDVSAMDGAVSTVRLWKMGHIGDTPETTIMPSKALINKLRNILANNVGGGTIDLVWSPDIQVEEINTEVHKFLGKAKYEPVLANIYEGLGVPFVSDSAGKGMTNNFIQMQTFVERLQYGRNVLTSFWDSEIKKVQKAMGYKKPAIVSFDQVNLGDDSSYKQALLGLLDRDVISIDTILDNFGLFSNIEKIKLKKEYSSRSGKKLPNKASPFHNPQSEDDMKKIFIQRGGIAPSELGIELNPKKDGELSPNEELADTQLKLAEKTNQAKVAQQKFSPSAPNGRPKGTKDSGKRKQKVAPISTKGFVNTFLWGCKAQDHISSIVTPLLLSKVYNKSTVRSLTSEEFSRLEATKLAIFSNLNPFDSVTEDLIRQTAATKTTVNTDVQATIHLLLSSFRDNYEREPTVDEVRQIQASAFAIVFSEENSEES